MSLGTGLGKLPGKAFRIGHLGDLNALILCGTLCGVEMALALAKVPIAGRGRRGGSVLGGSGRHGARCAGNGFCDLA